MYEFSMNHFRTKDIALSAALLHQKCRFVSIDRTQSKSAEFVFEGSEELREIVDQYWRDELMCPAQSLLAAFKRAKHILYDYKPHE